MNTIHSDSLKPFGQTDPNFVEYLNKIVNITSRGGVKIRGALIEIDGSFLVIQHKDGRRTRIRITEVSVIFEMRGV
jgi:small nuclear ribonucleoprotein (snRNP)-like protein